LLSSIWANGWRRELTGGSGLNFCPARDPSNEFGMVMKTGGEKLLVDNRCEVKTGNFRTYQECLREGAGREIEYIEDRNIRQ